MNLADVGTSERVDEVISGYPGLYAGLFANETDALLAALLMEQRAERTGVNPTTGQDAREPQDIGGTYYSFEATVAPGEWTHVEPEFVSSAVDLRRLNTTGNDLLVAFSESKPSAVTSADSDAVVRYRTPDFPIAGLEVETGNIWLRADDNDDANGVDLLMEVWS